MLFLIVAIVLALIIFSFLRAIAVPLIILVLAIMVWNSVKDARDPGPRYEKVELLNGKKTN